MATLVVVPCGKSKIWDRYPAAGPTPAREAYTGTPFKVNKEYAETFAPHSWLILSAKHGLVEPGFVVPENYNVTFDDDRTNPISEDRLKRQVREQALDRFGKVIVLGNRKYVGRIRAAFKETEVDIVAPLEDLPAWPPGIRMRAVRAAIDLGKPFDGPGQSAKGKPDTRPNSTPRTLVRPQGVAGNKTRIPTTEDFQRQLQAIFGEAEGSGATHIDVRASELHRRVGGYPGRNHRMFSCCGVMWRNRREGDEVFVSPPSGRGPSLTIRYKLPR